MAKLDKKCKTCKKCKLQANLMCKQKILSIGFRKYKRDGIWKLSNSRKTSASACIDYIKAFDSVDHNKQTVENSWRDGNTRPPYLPPEKLVCRSGSNS